MHRRPIVIRKRRTREHVIADLSVNFVERQALLCGHAVERWLHDYGIDLTVRTFAADGQVEGGAIYLQVKATDHLRRVVQGRFVAVDIERSDLQAWLIEPFPVILIVYDAPNERAYWFYVQAAFPGARRFRAVRGSASLTVRIPIGQVLDATAIRRFQLFRDSVLHQSEEFTHDE